MITRLLLATALVVPTALVAAPADAAGRADRDVATKRWSTTQQLRHGSTKGVRVRRGALVFRRATETRRYHGRTYEMARWTSPWVRPGFAADELIASWNARTPKGSWVEIAVRGHRRGNATDWDVLGRWAHQDRRFHRSSAGSQPDGPAHVNVDTLQTDGRKRINRWQLQVRLLRILGTDATPSVQSVGAMASDLSATRRTSRTSMRRFRSLDVPRYSQMIHEGEYPRWDGGGEAWCSPTSTSMVLGYWDSLPTRRQYRWVDDDYRDPWVDHAARFVYDYRYDGAGNWPFNTAYAGTYGLDAFVTRLRTLREAERFIRAGIPLVASIAFGAGELDGSPLTSTGGHLLVIRGFTKHGDVVANDPAARRSKGVRRVYDRGQFENVWLDTTGGTTYVIRPAGHPLPRRTPQRNW